MDSHALTILSGMAATPVGLLVAAALMGARYRRALARSMARSAAGGSTPRPVAPEASPGRPRLTLQIARSADAEQGLVPADRALEDARDAAVRLRQAYLAAALAYAVVATVAFAVAAARMPLDVRLAIACLLLVPEMAILIAFLDIPVRRQLWIYAAYGLTGALLALALVGPVRSMKLLGLAGLFALYPLPALAVLLARRLRPFLVGLGALLLLVGVGALAAVGLGIDRRLTAVSPWTIALGAANVVLGVAVFDRLLHRRCAVAPVAALAASAVAGLAIERLSGPVLVLETMAGVLCGVPLNVLQVFVVWLVFKLLVQVQERRLLPAKVLHAHLCWGLLTLYLTMLAGLTEFFGDRGWLPWAPSLAWLLQAAILHWMLSRLRAERKGKPAQRLLLLRAFGNADQSERLLDLLEGTWLWLGPIDVVAASDVALRTLRASMVEAFLLRRIDERFLKTEDEVDRRLQQLESRLEGDGRHPLNGVYCYESAWRRAVMRLGPASDVVLMDLRGFSLQNEGCAFELAYLVQRVTLPRVVLVVDRRTDFQALEQVVHAAWADLPADSPNAHDLQPVLTVFRLTTGSRGDASALFGPLLRAAFAKEPAPEPA